MCWQLGKVPALHFMGAMPLWSSFLSVPGLVWKGGLSLQLGPLQPERAEEGLGVLTHHSLLR